jgi:hypothetical protein
MIPTESFAGTGPNKARAITRRGIAPPAITGFRSSLAPFSV